jgi:signal transduction histidine kinase
MQLSRRPRFFATLKPSLLLGVALSACIGMLCYYVTRSTIDKENAERFRKMAHTAQFTLDARIKSYTTVLRATASLFSAEPNITREKFHRFFTSLNLAEHYPAIVVLNYASLVTDENRDGFEARVRRELELAHDTAPLFTIHPQRRSSTYAPVLFVEPQEKWAHTLGYDLNSIPIHLKSLDEARDSGLISASGTPVQPMQDPRNLGLGLRLPIYTAGAPVNTIAQRRAAYVGSVGIAFGVKRFVDGVLDELPLKTVRLSLFNYIQTLNPEDLKPSQLIYDSSATDDNPRPVQTFNDPTQYDVWLPVDFNGRQWTAHFTTPKVAVNRPSDSSFPMLAMLAGFTSTMLLYGLFYTLTSSRARAIELAKGMTSELRESQAQLLLSHKKLRQLAAHTEHIKEIERKRIAREIHDDLGQNLLALRIEAQMLSSCTNDRHPRLHARAATTLGQIDATIKSVRQIINDLRPTVLDLGLNAAVDWQIAEFERRTGIKCDLVEYHKEIVVDDHCATALFRILQESLTNVRRHASASWVRVDLRVEHGLVRMSIRDNGVGLRAGGYKPGRFGLIGIEERVTMLGGSFSLTDAPGGGTTVEVAIPVLREKSRNAAYVHEFPDRYEDEMV